MERNANDTFGNQGTDSSTGATGATSGNDSNFSRDTSTDGGGLRDRAQNLASQAGEKLGSAGSSVRERAGTLKDTLADALESGADRLRQQAAGGGQAAGAPGTGTGAGTGAGVIATDENRLAQTGNQIAGGLQASADWLRDADLDGMKVGIEKQVKEHPGRTLAIAVGLGYLLGKALRK